MIPDCINPTFPRCPAGHRRVIRGPGSKVPPCKVNRGFRVQDLGFRVKDLAFRIEGSGIRMHRLASSWNLFSVATHLHGWLCGVGLKCITMLRTAWLLWRKWSAVGEQWKRDWMTCLACFFLTSEEVWGAKLLDSHHLHSWDPIYTCLGARHTHTYIYIYTYTNLSVVYVCLACLFTDLFMLAYVPTYL